MAKSALTSRVMEMDDEGRFPDEPGYGKGPDWKPPFQESEEGELTIEEEAFLMDDANFDTGGNLNETDAQGNFIGDFEIGTNWKPTVKGKPSSQGASFVASMNASAKPDTQRRNIREKKTLITGSV